ncbi:gastrula zinc finger protein XlCGF8.2DB-like [Limulus polyphemus]|uniref:Gastrula zinc finger protein XlCGF8.2DB-like n=1 Tax=Limulus polyphemus TaxID=6850 RepID=A0ABM1S6F7_LIMPO|nr:gastrula zinc finger protein XlCGF8.2DB-like [Limulus polyphemus]XP_022239209.1 gastrula zinc finger protein XlCGF8.2DB-like [Limulus polyphemus]XP_022239210.1 gastrula zinc finger protein XlCGF8.2DB-like [Limulus polyphemus]XP_022239211.1 gastrula zinc finger protein XlCGF8.2DB-like [Limulus polyphemus]XP_022239212.1 gastrula zinc finger protein XlCGF8.2DB-like [Limulus polyphemus]
MDSALGFLARFSTHNGEHLQENIQSLGGSENPETLSCHGLNSQQHPKALTNNRKSSTAYNSRDMTINKSSSKRQSIGEDLQIGMESNSVKIYFCNCCGKSYSEKDSGLHSSCLPMEIYSCSICGEKFNLKKTLLDHCFSLHGIIQSFICNFCGKCFSSKESFQNHQTIHSGDKPYPCEVCFQKFSEKRFLLYHLRSHYSEKPYRCQYCGKSYTLKGNLQIHLQDHEGVKPFSCKVCNKNFTQKVVLDHHMSVHTGKRPYPCQVCDKTFSQKGNLKTHMLIHTGERRFSCPQCGRFFTQKGNMKTHLKLHLQHPSIQKPYYCIICRKSYVSEASLQCHMVCHQKLIPFVPQNVATASTSEHN